MVQHGGRLLELHRHVTHLVALRRSHHRLGRAWVGVWGVGGGWGSVAAPGLRAQRRLLEGGGELLATQRAAEQGEGSGAVCVGEGDL